MATRNSQSPKATIQFTEYGIPIRNLWHMLLYAWNDVPLQTGWMMKDIERAPTLDALLASMLVKLMQQRMRVGLGHDYVEKEKTIRGIRGRIDFAESLKRHAFERGEAHCDFQGYSSNDPKNQIIRSTLSRLVQTGQFGPETDTAIELRNKLRQQTRDLNGIDLIEVTPNMVRRQLSARNDHDYHLMLSICDLVLQRQMPANTGGETAVPAVDHEALVLHNIYERFVANFYRLHLTDWNVAIQKRLDWHAKETSDHLPLMIPDLVLQERSSGQLIILDTKFTARSLGENQWGKPIFDSAHLYQLYAYLKSQEHISEAHRTATGILLYPAVQYKLSERIELQDHVIRVESVDLARAWQVIEKGLMELVNK